MLRQGGRKARNLGLDILWVLLLCQCSQSLLDAGGLWCLNWKDVLAEWLIAAFIILLAFAVTASRRRALIWGSVPLMLLTVANAELFIFRGNALMPLDFLSFTTAMNVAGSYRPQVSWRMAISLLAWAALIFAETRRRDWRPRRRAWGRLAGLGAALAVLLCWQLLTSGMTAYYWMNYGEKYKGYFNNFSIQLREALADHRPEGYDVQQVEETAREFSGEEEAVPDTLPDIIVIMDESFSDLRVVGDLKTEEPVTPFLDSIKENTVRGSALSSVYGGGTANSEWEVLTGDTMAFLPVGSVVYQQYLSSDSFSMARYLKSLGYRTLATHPFRSSGWMRTSAWPRLGFDEMTFQEDYPMENLLRYYETDQEMFEYVLDRLEGNTSGQPLFLFGVTMQNHGGYDNPAITDAPHLALEGMQGDYPQAEVYLGLLRESDRALEYLIGELEKRDRPTVLLFFGDHLPALDEGFYEELHGGPIEDNETEESCYTVPFILWTNYDIEERQIDLTSLNYLSGYVYDVAGIPLPAWNRFLRAGEEEVKAINTLGWYDADGGFHQLSEETAWLKQYRALQYNNLFDTVNRNNILFPIGEATGK